MWVEYVCVEVGVKAFAHWDLTGLADEFETDSESCT